MTTTEYLVAGLTCGHCVTAVRDEVGGLAGVSDVTVDLIVGGNSTVTVTSAGALPLDALSAAVEEAGDYRLVTR